MNSGTALTRGLVILGIASLIFLAGCGSSASQPFNNQSPPAITTISPTSAAAGGAAFTLTVNGTNFLAASVVNFGGMARTTTFVSATQLTAAIPAAAIAPPGTASVTVMNPPPGGTSNTVNFAVNTASSETFTATGSMTTARAGHTATLLPSGKVLIAGGARDLSAELYDPFTGTFTPTGNMTAVRTRWHTATLLANGKVLVAGGFDRSEQPLDSAELYDPSTGTFTPTGSMTKAEVWRPATLLHDGKVFVAGTTNAEIYDPATGTFGLTGPYADPTPALWLTATLLLDGRVLLTGCATAELFDPSTGTFSVTGGRRCRVDGVYTATLLMNGKVLLVESADDPFPADHEDLAELYDPATGTFSDIGYLGETHEFSAVVRLPDGTVLITGGQLIGGSGSAGSELYLPPTGIFASAGNMTMGRHSHTATLLPDGTVLIAGGWSVWPTPTATAEIYKPTSSGP